MQHLCPALYDQTTTRMFHTTKSRFQFVRFGPLLCSILVMVGIPAFAQPTIHSINQGNLTSCSHTFLDSGGQGASGYGNNENFISTICPDEPGEAISLQWITANLSLAGNAPVDRIRIYDGNSTADPLIGEYTGTQLQGQIVSASSTNPSGCLTVQFTSNNTGTGVFAALVTCYNPCERPTANATVSQPTPVLLCMGNEIQFDGSTSTAAAGFNIVDHTWDFADGTTASGPVVSHSWSEPGEYIVQLYVTDNNDCINNNLVDIQVLVSTVPSFNASITSETTCLGATVEWDIEVTPTTWTGAIGGGEGAGLPLPDLVAATSTITFGQFGPGQTLNNINDLQSVCVNMEHSFMGDLVISLTCPSGQNVIFHQQGGGGTDLGIPGPGNNQGTCWQYCWSPTATNGTWVANSGAFGALPAGTYQSLQPMSNLVGCQLNGTWTLNITDLWAADDGWLCNWSIDFDPSIIPDATEFTPVVGLGPDSTQWTGPNIVVDPNNPLSASVTPTAPGTYDYSFSVIDNFGCSYDTTVTITIAPQIVVDAGPDIVLCNDPVPMAGQLVANAAPPNCTYVLTLFDSANNGWSGGLFGTTASVTITVNGVANNYTLAAGGIATFNIPVTPGATIVISYATGSNNNQNSFNLRNDEGLVVYQSPNGPPAGQLWTGVATCGGAVTPTQYAWSPTTGLDNPTSLTTNVFTTTPTWYYLTVNPVGQPECAVVDSVLVGPDPSIDAGEFNSITLCASQPIFLLTDSLNGTPDAGGVWTDAAGNVVPEVFDPLTGLSGTYTYTITSAAGCVATQNLEITIIPADAPQCCGDVDAGEPEFSCTLSIGLNAIPGNTGVGVWSGPPGATFVDASDAQTTATMPAGTGGTHWFYWTEDDGNFCFLVDSVQMTVTDPIQITFDLNDAVCFTYCDGDATASVTGGNPGNLTYAWSTGANGIAVDAIDGLCAGNYSLTVTDVEGCSGSANFTIAEPPLLEIDFIIPQAVTCFGDCDGRIALIDGQAVEYSYDGGSTWSVEPLLENLCVGSFDLAIRDAAGCIGTGSTEIIGPPPVVADFTWSPNPTNVNNPAILFFNASNGANRFEWDIAGVASPTTIDAQYRFTDREPGIYPVCLIAYNSNNCSDTVCYDVVIDDVTFVYVPNSFTPDGDGVNDGFFVSTTVALDDFNMLIFDRWGQVVYETRDFGQPWNGGYRNDGDVLPTGVYAYRIQYRIPETATRKELVGSVTLLK